MEALKSDIFSILNGSKQFLIPIYQRTYSWELQQCTQLWSDLVEMQLKQKSGHFVGSIVNITEKAMPTGVQRFMIIDGQQRLTTLALLMIALRNYIKDRPENLNLNYQQIDGMLLKNEYANGDERYKLLLTENDRDIFINLIEDRPLSEIENQSRLVTNYKFFLDKINKKELSPAQIYESIGKLQIVNITLDRTMDDAQAIFESLNSTGKALSSTDLIRNFLLMGLEPKTQNEIYSRYWRPFEKLFKPKDEWRMDYFFRDYLTLKQGRITIFSQLYDTFKNYKHRNEKISIQDFCKDILMYATYFHELIYQKSTDPEIKTLYEDIASLHMEVSFPFILWARNLLTEGTISLDEYKKTLQLCISYVLRRNVCSVPTNSLNNNFVTLKNAISTSSYLKSLLYQFASFEKNKTFPSDEWFINELTKRDLFQLKTNRYILSKLENYDNKALVDTKKLTIEHIMPQNPKLSKKWQECLGENWKEIQKNYLHTLGNLTLTAYNSEMSDRSFEEKLEIKGGFKQSALRLNSYVVQQTTWNKDKIIERANLLSSLALKIWPYPNLNEDQKTQLSQDSQSQSTYHLEDYEFYKVQQTLFEALNSKILEISPEVSTDFNKLYLSYRIDSIFTSLTFLQKGIKVNLNLPYSLIKDPQGLCRDVSTIGHWASGDSEFTIENASQIDYATNLIEQAFNYQAHMD